MYSSCQRTVTNGERLILAILDQARPAGFLVLACWIRLRLSQQVRFWSVNWGKGQAGKGYYHSAVVRPDVSRKKACHWGGLPVQGFSED